MEPKVYFDLALAYAGPIISFFFGVFIADKIGLYTSLKRRHVYLISIPVGLTTVGFLLSSTSVLVEGTAEYGHTQSFPRYMTFCGTIMFYGAAAPELFGVFLTRLIRQERAKGKRG